MPIAAHPVRRRLPMPVEPLGRALVWARGSSTGLLVMALIVGATTGLGAAGFRILIGWLTMLFTGQVDYSVANHASNPWVPQLGPWFLLFVPVIGGLLYGPLVERFAPEARGHGVPEVMVAIAEQGARIRPRVAVIKAVASAICIAAGGSVGREGPVVQVGSAIGSTTGQVLGIPESRLRILVACGAAGGISATFNAPIAGVMFGLELILRDFQAQSFGVVVLSSVLANAVAASILGGTAFLTLPPFALVSPWELLVYAGLGLVAAFVGIAFVRVLYAFEDFSDRIWRGPLWLRPAAGGFLLGGLLLALPEMYGVGHAVLERAIGGEYVLWFLLLLLAGKILATSVTIAIGGSGGVFAPSLFIGAMLGTAYGQVMHRFFPSITGDPGAYGLVGMGALFAAAARAPITSVIIILELTSEYSTIPPLLFSVAVATAVSAFLSKETIYTLKLHLRGIELGKPRGPTLMEVLKVGDAMEAVPEALTPGLGMGEVMERLRQSDALPLIDADGKYEGTVTAAEVERAIREDTFDPDLRTHAQQPPKLRLQDNLARAVRRDRAERALGASGAGSGGSQRDRVDHAPGHSAGVSRSAGAGDRAVAATDGRAGAAAGGAARLSGGGSRGGAAGAGRGGAAVGGAVAAVRAGLVRAGARGNPRRGSGDDVDARRPGDGAGTGGRRRRSLARHRARS